MEMLRKMKPEVVKRLGMIRANASVKTHQELDQSETLDRGDPLALADAYMDLKSLLLGLKVVGGCCGTDEEHLRCIAERLLGKDEGGILKG